MNAMREGWRMNAMNVRRQFDERLFSAIFDLILRVSLIQMALRRRSRIPELLVAAVEHGRQGRRR